MSSSAPEIHLIDCYSFDHDEFLRKAKRLLRPELYRLLREGNKIQRFRRLGLPDKLIKGETVKVHTLRLLCRVEQLDLNADFRDKYRLTVLIHDLPEVAALLQQGKYSDLTAPEKASNNKLDEQISKNESEIAITVFNDNELSLYQEFVKASEYLKDRSDVIPTGIGLICKMLDKVDADLFFHLTILKGIGELSELNEAAQKLAFEQYKPFSKRICRLFTADIKSEAEFAQKLLDSCMEEIVELWEGVDEENMPDVICDCLIQK